MAIDNIAFGRWHANHPLLPPDSKLPWYIEVGEYVWDCPICGSSAYSVPDADDERLWCPVDGVIAPPSA